MQKRNFWFNLSLVCLLLISCADDHEYDMHHQCYLVIDNSIHLDATLMSATNQLSPGIFCRISLGTKGGAEAFYFETNQGLSSSFILNDVDRQRTHICGIYNQSGVIVGYGTLENPAVFYAYDAQCPNCYEKSNLPQAKLSMTTDGKANCLKCHRVYDLNNNGIEMSEQGGKKLYRYRTNPKCPAPQGILTISNR